MILVVESKVVQLTLEQRGRQRHQLPAESEIRMQIKSALSTPGFSAASWPLHNSGLNSMDQMKKIHVKWTCAV